MNEVRKTCQQKRKIQEIELKISSKLDFFNIEVQLIYSVIRFRHTMQTFSVFVDYTPLKVIAKYCLYALCCMFHFCILFCSWQFVPHSFLLLSCLFHLSPHLFVFCVYKSVSVLLYPIYFIFQIPHISEIRKCVFV